MAKSKLLSGAVKTRADKSNSDRIELDRYKSEIAELMERRISISLMNEGLEDLGFDLTHSWLRRYLINNFPELYEKHYRRKGLSVKQASSSVSSSSGGESSNGNKEGESSKESNSGKKKAADGKALSETVLKKYRAAVIDPKLKNETTNKNEE